MGAFLGVVFIIALIAYVAYQLFFATIILRGKYTKESKILALPEGMTSESLFQALNGKLNYPYFKGVRYGANGECLVEGKYSSYPVTFSEPNNVATIGAELNRNRKDRPIMLEAIAIQHYIDKFFNPALPYDAGKYHKALKSAVRDRLKVVIGIAVVVVILIAVFVMDKAPGIEVRQSYLAQYSSSITIEDAFAGFFDKSSWSTYKESGTSYVVFKGVCLVANERSDIKMTFKITGENFVISDLEIDGQEEMYMLTTLLNAVYNE